MSTRKAHRGPLTSSHGLSHFWIAYRQHMNKCTQCSIAWAKLSLAGRHLSAGHSGGEPSGWRHAAQGDGDECHRRSPRSTCPATCTSTKTSPRPAHTFQASSTGKILSNNSAGAHTTKDIIIWRVPYPTLPLPRNIITLPGPAQESQAGTTCERWASTQLAQDQKIRSHTMVQPSRTQPRAVAANAMTNIFINKQLMLLQVSAAWSRVPS